MFYPPKQKKEKEIIFILLPVPRSFNYISTKTYKYNKPSLSLLFQIHILIIEIGKLTKKKNK